MNVFNYTKGYGKGHPEETLFEIFEYLEGYSIWRKELNDRYDHHRVDSIQRRINMLQIYLKVLQTDTESTLFQLANIEMTPDILRELDSLNALGTLETKNSLKPLIQWKGIEKGSILSELFPKETAYSLAKKYHDKLEVDRGTLKSAIESARNKNKPISILQIDLEQAKKDMQIFLGL